MYYENDFWIFACFTTTKVPKFRDVFLYIFFVCFLEQLNESLCCLLVVRGSRRTFISIQLRGTSLPRPWTSMCFTYQMFVWVEGALSQGHALSLSHKHRYYRT